MELTRDCGQAGEKATLRIVQRFGPEALFGESELRDGMLPRAHILAETALSVLSIPQAIVRQLRQGAARNAMR